MLGKVKPESCHVVFLELAVDELVNDGCLSDSSVAQDNDLELFALTWLSHL